MDMDMDMKYVYERYPNKNIALIVCMYYVYMYVTYICMYVLRTQYISTYYNKYMNVYSIMYVYIVYCMYVQKG